MTDSSTVPSPTAQLSTAKQALLAERLRRRAGAVRRPTIPARPFGAAPPLSYAQERLWFLEQFAPGTAGYTIPLALRLRGPLDVAALGPAPGRCGGAARRPAHALPVDRRRPAARDRRRPGPRCRCAVADAAGDEAARAVIDESWRRPFDLAAGPLVRPLLVRLAADDHVLAIALHHIVGDGWSTDVLIREHARAATAGRAAAALPVPATATTRPGSGTGAAATAADLDHWRRPAGRAGAAGSADRPAPPARADLRRRRARLRAGRRRSLDGLLELAPRRGATLVHGAARRLRRRAGPLWRNRTTSRRVAGGRPFRAGAGAAGRLFREHADAAGRPVRRPDPSRSCWPGCGTSRWTPTPTRSCRSSSWSPSSTCRATCRGRRCSAHPRDAELCLRRTEPAARPGRGGLRARFLGHPVRPGVVRRRERGRHVRLVHLQCRPVRAGHDRPAGRAPGRPAPAGRRPARPPAVGAGPAHRTRARSRPG